MEENREGERRERLVLEVDVGALRRLLRRRVISAEEFRSVDRVGKQRLQQLFLHTLSHELAGRL